MARGFIARSLVGKSRPVGDLNDPVAKLGSRLLHAAGRLYHIGIGRTHARTRVSNAATGETLRELVLDPDRNYQPTGRPPGPPPGRRKTTSPEP